MNPYQLIFSSYVLNSFEKKSTRQGHLTSFDTSVKNWFSTFSPLYFNLCIFINSIFQLNFNLFELIYIFEGIQLTYVSAVSKNICLKININVCEVLWGYIIFPKRHFIESSFCRNVMSSNVDWSTRHIVR